MKHWVELKLKNTWKRVTTVYSCLNKTRELKEELDEKYYCIYTDIRIAKDSDGHVVGKKLDIEDYICQLKPIPVK